MYADTHILGVGHSGGNWSHPCIDENGNPKQHEAEALRVLACFSGGRGAIHKAAGHQMVFSSRLRGATPLINSGRSPPYCPVMGAVGKQKFVSIPHKLSGHREVEGEARNKNHQAVAVVTRANLQRIHETATIHTRRQSHKLPKPAAYHTLPRHVAERPKRKSKVALGLRGKDSLSSSPAPGPKDRKRFLTLAAPIASFIIEYSLR